MNRHSLTALAALTIAAAAPLSAQEFDRRQPPVLAKPSDLAVPRVETATLPNGITITLVEMHEVPLVQITARLKGGARLDGAIPGLATFTADMLTEGAGSRNAAAISAQAAYLGATLRSGADWDDLAVSLNTPMRTLDSALALMSDVVLRPPFHTQDVVRQRDLRQADIAQQKDEPEGMAFLTLGAVLFPESHPYHRPIGGDSAGTALLDSATVRRFYTMVARPDQVEFIVTGDISLAQAQKAIAARFGAWPRAARSGAKPYMPPPIEAPAARTLFLVDKPGAAQSVIIIGAPGVARSNPDYAAIEVMNTILGGSFSSRLNQNLRESHGYTYGAQSFYQYHPIPGPFLAVASVRTEVTDSSLIQFFLELNRIRDTAVTAVELERARNYIGLGYPGQFETTGQMAQKVGEMLTFGLPATTFRDYVRSVGQVTAADVQRVARQYFDPARVDVVVVGDVSKVRAGIEALGLGAIELRQ
ncbi:MAG: pitrilysin family protein [Gemmatimonadota bacterium]